MAEHLEFQAAAREHSGEPVTFTLAGEKFRCAQSLGIMPLLELAAESDADADSAEGLAALYDFLRSIIADPYVVATKQTNLAGHRYKKGDAIPADLATELLEKDPSMVVVDEWRRFRRCVKRNRMDTPALMGVVRGLMPALAGRPTTPPPSSGAAPSSNGASSTGGGRAAVSAASST